MDLQVLRISSQNESTLGILFDITQGTEFLAYSLEDEFRTKKVYAETRIPAGEYEIKFRKKGGFHQRYTAKYGSMHKGMLHVQDVPGFEYILIHTGNDDDDTAGCLLVGDSQQQNISKQGQVLSSVSAYKRIYPAIAKALESGEKVTINYIDFDSVN